MDRSRRYLSMALIIWATLIAINLAAHIKNDQTLIDSYENYKVYQIMPRDFEDLKLLAELEKESDLYGLDFWQLDKVPGHKVEVMVAPRVQAEFEEMLTEANIPFYIFIHDYQHILNEENLENNGFNFRRSAKKSGSLDLSRYYKYNEIIDYITKLSKDYPKTVKAYSAGKSYEERNIPAIVITNGDGNTNKNTIVMDAGIHPREWIAPAEALYVINQLVENATAYKDILDKFNWVILPILNVDGYEYTHTNNRMWRKTRKPSSNTCIGTDANRNFGFEWGGVGASTNPCSDTYRGETSFSEPETKVLRDVLKKYQKQAKFYLTLHSYGSYLLYPWGYTSDLPSNWQDLHALVNVGAQAIQSTTGTRYTIGSSTNVLYAAAGGSDDYALGELGIPYAVTMELPRGGTGFDPPPSQIERLVSETWIGIHAMAQHLADEFSLHDTDELSFD